MKSTPYVFNGRTYALSFTAEALFTIYDKFGVTADLIGTTKILEPTAEGWKNLCWVAALLAAQGELQRRNLGYDKQPMLPMEDLRLELMASDAPALREIVVAAMEQGFHRDAPEPEEDEVDLVLLEREEAEKKKKAQLSGALNSWLQRLAGFTSDRQTPSS